MGLLKDLFGFDSVFKGDEKPQKKNYSLFYNEDPPLKYSKKDWADRQDFEYYNDNDEFDEFYD